MTKHRQHDAQALEPSGRLIDEATMSASTPLPQGLPSSHARVAHLQLSPARGVRAASGGNADASRHGDGRPWSDADTAETWSRDNASTCSAEHSWLPCSPDGSPSPDTTSALFAPAPWSYSKSKGLKERDPTWRGGLVLDKVEAAENWLAAAASHAPASPLSSAARAPSSSSSTINCRVLEQGWFPAGDPLSLPLKPALL